MGEARQRKLAKAAGRPWPKDAGLPFQGVTFSNRLADAASPWEGANAERILEHIATVLRMAREPPVVVMSHVEPPPRFLPMPEIAKLIVADPPVVHFSVTGRPPGRPRGK